MANPFLIAGAGAAIRGFGSFLENRARQKEMARLRMELLRTLEPEEQALAGRKMGFSEVESSLGGRQASIAFQNLSAAGVGQSSLIGPAALEAIAPIAAARDQQIREEMFRLGAARRNILLATSGAVGSPGTAAFGGFLGDVGDVFALQAGRQFGTSDAETEALIRKIMREEALAA